MSNLHKFKMAVVGFVVSLYVHKCKLGDKAIEHQSKTMAPDVDCSRVDLPRGKIRQIRWAGQSFRLRVRKSIFH